MDEKELKTSPKQRFFIILIAVLMLGSIVASYAAIVLNNGGSASGTNTSETISDEKMQEYEEAYNAKTEEFSKLAEDDFERFVKYKSKVTAYNENAANGGGIQVEDLEVGTGRKLEEGDTDYLAYYIGWCADESVFDSTFDNSDDPKSFVRILDASSGMIEGWNLGVEGMRIDGIREITISSELAYGDSTEICGGYNKPLKFIVMPKENEGELGEVAAELEEATMRYQYALYGIDYDMMLDEEE